MDFYIKYIGDPNYQTNVVQNNGEIEQLLTQIETTLFTRKTDVLGQPDFGCNLEDLVYGCLLYTSPSPRDGLLSRMPSSA